MRQNTSQECKPHTVRLTKSFLPLNIVDHGFPLYLKQARYTFNWKGLLSLTERRAVYFEEWK